MLSSSQNVQRFLIDTTSVNRTSSQRLVEMLCRHPARNAQRQPVFVLC